MTRYLLGNLSTGRRILDLPVLKGSWEQRLGAPETIRATIDLNDPDAQALDLDNTAAPAMTFLAVAEGDMILAAGPIWVADYDADKRILELAASGLGSYFNYRHILPLLARTIPVSQWTVEVPDPENPGELMTIPNPALATTSTNAHLGTIAKGLVQQAEEWAGGDLPIVYEDDRPGIHARTYNAIDFKPILEAHDDLANVENGVESRFTGRFAEDGLGVEWVFETGDPLIHSDTVHLWDRSVPHNPISGLRVVKNAAGLAGLSWAQGGKQEDTVLIARAEDTTLIDAGYPLMEILDTSHSTVSEQPTLDGYAQGNLRTRPVETWQFTTEAFPVDDEGVVAGPQLGQYRMGDYCDIVSAAWKPVTDTEDEQGDPYLERSGGVSRHRIIGLSGDEQGQRVQVTLAPRMED